MSAAEALVAGLPIWSGRVTPEPLVGGLSNTNFVVRDRGGRYMVRVAGDVEAHGVIRRNEVAATRAAHAAGLAPEVVHVGPGVLVLRFIEGCTWTPADLRDPANLPRIVEVLHRCHRDVAGHLRGPTIMFWVFHAIRDYLHRLGEEGGDTAQLGRFATVSAALEQAVGPVDLVFGHNDLLAANFIDDGRRLWLLDWEYGGFNSPLFDLGGLASNNALPAEGRERLLEAYFEGGITDERRLAFAAMTAASLLRESLWSMVSESYSSIDFDYRAYTAENVARFEAAHAAFLAMTRS